MKYIGENAIKKLISLIKGDLATKQPTITASGLLKGDGAGTVTAADTQEATLVDVPNGLLKGDGTTISAAVAGTDYVVPSTALNELPGHLGNTSIHVTASDKENWNQKANLVITEIPKGRMRGDVDGDGKITKNDASQIGQHVAGIITLTGADLWCADVNADGEILSSDSTILNQYLGGFGTSLTSTPTFADYYNNWTYHKVDNTSGYWTTDLSIPAITAEMGVSIVCGGNVLEGTFIKAEPFAGGVRIYANYPPIEALPCEISYATGVGGRSIIANTGVDGADGITPHIDETTKHWMIGNTDTGIIAEGKTSYIGDNGNWYEWDATSGTFVDSGVSAHPFPYVQPNEPIDAPEFSLWVDTDEESVYIARAEGVGF